MKSSGRRKRQGAVNMPVADMVVNGQQIQVLRYFSNSLSEEACAEYKLDSVDMDIVHTKLNSFAWNITTPNTYGFVYYVPTKLSLPAERVSALIGLRLFNQAERNTGIETILYNGDKYESQYPTFSLHGSMGCTAALNLGIYLLMRTYRYTIRQIDMLFIFDADRLAERLKFNLPVDDDSIIEFCRQQNTSLVAAASAQSDCHKWRQCKDQEGLKCEPEALLCK